jgi:hypothetical protein
MKSSKEISEFKIIKVFIPQSFFKELNDFGYLILKDSDVKNTTEVIKNPSQLRSFVIRRLIKGYNIGARKRIETKALAKIAAKESRLESQNDILPYPKG